MFVKGGRVLNVLFIYLNINVELPHIKIISGKPSTYTTQIGWSIWIIESPYKSQCLFGICPRYQMEQWIPYLLQLYRHFLSRRMLWMPDGIQCRFYFTFIKHAIIASSSSEDLLNHVCWKYWSDNAAARSERYQEPAITMVLLSHSLTNQM